MTVQQSLFTAPQFDDAFRARLEQLFHWRRDVRRFRPDPVPAKLMEKLIFLATLAPSVGNSQPWRFVKVNDPGRRRRIWQNFRDCNAEALGDYAGARAKLYANLKLAGLEEAPVHMAVFVDHGTKLGHGLGRRTMPEMLPYSVVAAINSLWLAARAEGIGVGWVSILEPGEIAEILEVPGDWSLIGYLCIGYPQEEHDDPELERHGWQGRANPEDLVIER